MFNCKQKNQKQKKSKFNMQRNKKKKNKENIETCSRVYIKPYSSLLTGRGWHSWSFTHGKNLIYSTTKVSLFWNEFKQFIYTRPWVWTVRTATNMRDIVGQSLGVMSPGHRLNQSGIDHVSQGLSSPLHSEYFNFFLNIYLFYTCLRLCAHYF